MARGPERRLVTLVVEPHAEEPADVIGDEPIWHDGQVVGWVTSGVYAHHSGLSLALGYVPAALAEPALPARVMAASRSRSSATAAPPTCSPSRRSTPRACGCARDDPGAGRRTAGVLGRRHGRARRPAGRAAPRPRRDAVPGRRLRELRRRGRRRGLRPHVPDPGAATAWSCAATREVGGPPLLGGRPAATGTAPAVRHRPAPSVRHVSVDVAVVGQGESGRAELAALRAEGRDVLVLDAGHGQEVVTIDHGPTLVVRVTDDDGRVELVHAHAHEVVLATGAAELQPVCPGNRLRGLLTASAAVAAHAAGVELPDAIAVGDVPDGLPVRRGGRAARPPRRRCRRRRVGRGARPRRRPRDPPVPDRRGRARLGAARYVLARIAADGRVRCPSVPPRRSTPCRRRPSTASSARAPGRRSRTSTACGTAASGSWSWPSGPASAAPAPARGPSACPTCGPTWPTARAPSPPRSRPGRRRASSRWPRRPRAATSTPSAARRSTTSTSASARGSTASAVGGGRGPTATCGRSTTPSARASASATSRPSARWSSRDRTSSTRSSACTRTTCTTSGPGGPGTCSS